jgi:hypothetical protein
MTAALAVPPGGGGVATEGLVGTVLTHFSQRYPTIPPEQEGGGGRGRVLFAFDGMCIPLDPPKLEGEMIILFRRFAESQHRVCLASCQHRVCVASCPHAEISNIDLLYTEACESNG